MKRTLKEQEFQLLALKYRHEKLSISFLLEVILGLLVTFLLVMFVHPIAAACFGAWSILTCYSIFKTWRRYLNEYVTFKMQFDDMMERHNHGT